MRVSLHQGAEVRHVDTTQNQSAVHTLSSVARRPGESYPTHHTTAYDPRSPRPELIKSAPTNEDNYHALSDQVLDQTVSSMASAAAESLAGYAMAEGAIAGGAAAGGVAAGGAAAGGAAAGGSAGAAAGGAAAGSAAGGAAAAAATAGWIGAAIYGAVRVYEKFNMYLDRSHGAALTDEEIIKATNPRGIEQWLSKIPGHTMMKKLDPVFLIAKGIFGSSKNTDQIMRDRIRAQLKEAGVVGDDYLIKNPDGSTFDIGKDGGEPNYQLNIKNAMAGELVTMAAPLAMVITGGDEKLSSDFTGYFVNAALSGAGSEDFDVARQNLAELYTKCGITPDTVTQALGAMKQEENISDQELSVYTAAMNTLVNGVQSESQLTDMTTRVEKRQQLLDSVLAENPAISMEELTKQMTAMETGAAS